MTGRNADHPDPGLFESRYPNIATWVQDGWVEIGRDDYSRSFVRALDIGGMVWEGAESYDSLEAALQDLDDGIAAWRKEVGV
jgi:hypothetical protein